MQLPSNSHRKLEYPNNRTHALRRKMIHNKHSSALVSRKSIKISGKLFVVRKLLTCVS